MLTLHAATGHVAHGVSNLLSGQPPFYGVLPERSPLQRVSCFVLARVVTLSSQWDRPLLFRTSYADTQGITLWLQLLSDNLCASSRVCS